MRRPVVIAVACVAALALGACDDRTVRITKRSEDSPDSGVLKVVQTLTCPETVGALTRKAVSSDQGQICTYAGPRGAEVTLHLVPLNGETPDEALEAFETRLHQLMPEAASRVAPVPPAPDAPETPTPPPTPGTEGDERVDIRLPGLSISTEGETAEVRMPGVSVSSQEGGSRVAVAGVRVHSGEGGQSVTLGGGDGQVSVHSRDDISEVRVHAGGQATRTTYILSDSEPSSLGWRAVGYEARGPQGGPLIVATVKSKDREGDSVFDDAKDLVTLNVGE
ncbi:MAG: methyltransferase type 11 [Brevundimonas sp.]